MCSEKSLLTLFVAKGSISMMQKLSLYIYSFVLIKDLFFFYLFFSLCKLFLVIHALCYLNTEHDRRTDDKNTMLNVLKVIGSLGSLSVVGPITMAYSEPIIMPITQ